MSDPKDNEPDSKATGESAPPASGEAPVQGKRSGRVAFDSRGNPTWEWQLQTGVYSRDINTQKLKKLDLGDLSIAESAIRKQPPGLAQGSGPAVAPGGGFNPYDNSSRPSQKADPYDSARALSHQLKNTVAEKPQAVAAAPARRPVALKPAAPPKQSMLGKIEQWFRNKRRPGDDDEYE